jgi:hypothetical protein
LDKIKDLDESVHDLVFGVSNEEVNKTYDKAKVAFEKMQAKLGAISLPRPKQNSMNLKEMNQASMEEMHNIQTPEQWAEFKKKNNIK